MQTENAFCRIETKQPQQQQNEWNKIDSFSFFFFSNRRTPLMRTPSDVQSQKLFCVFDTAYQQTNKQTISSNVTFRFGLFCREFFSIEIIHWKTNRFFWAFIVEYSMYAISMYLLILFELTMVTLNHCVVNGFTFTNIYVHWLFVCLQKKEKKNTFWLTEKQLTIQLFHRFQSLFNLFERKCCLLLCSLAAVVLFRNAYQSITNASNKTKLQWNNWYLFILSIYSDRVMVSVACLWLFFFYVYVFLIEFFLVFK